MTVNKTTQSKVVYPKGEYSCKICKNIFYLKYDRYRSHGEPLVCSIDCLSKLLSSKLRKGIYTTCGNCNSEIYRKKYAYDYSKKHFCSIKCRIEYIQKEGISFEVRKKISLSHKPREFKGFIVDLNNKIRNSNLYLKWRNSVFERDNWTCQGCQTRGTYLEAHHNKSFKSILDESNIDTYKKAIECLELWDINNGVTLCLDCHNLTKKRSKK